MTIRYLVSEDEYVRANLLFGRPTRRRQIWLASAAALLVFVMLFAASDLQRLGAVGALAGGALGYWLLRYVHAPWQTRRQYRAYPAAHQPIDVNLEAEGLRVVDADSSCLLRWDRLVGWREDREFVLLYQNPRLYHIVPKRLEPVGLDLHGMLETLRSRLGEPG